MKRKHLDIDLGELPLMTRHYVEKTWLHTRKADEYGRVLSILLLPGLYCTCLASLVEAALFGQLVLSPPILLAAGCVWVWWLKSRELEAQREGEVRLGEIFGDEYDAQCDVSASVGMNNCCMRVDVTFDTAKEEE